MNNVDTRTMCGVVIVITTAKACVPDGSVVRTISRYIKCTVHDLEVLGSNPAWVDLGVHSISVVLEPKILGFCQAYLNIYY